jgi:hypothetical protein
LRSPDATFTSFSNYQFRLEDNAVRKNLIMKNIISILLVYMSYLVTMPSTASALNTTEISHVSHGKVNLHLAQFRRHSRQYYVYYRSRRDSRWNWNWTLAGFYSNRQDAEQAARRWENRGYQTSIRVRDRENNRRNDWDRGSWSR